MNCTGVAPSSATLTSVFLPLSALNLNSLKLICRTWKNSTAKWLSVPDSVNVASAAASAFRNSP